MLEVRVDSGNTFILSDEDVLEINSDNLTGLAVEVKGANGSVAELLEITVKE